MQVTGSQAHRGWVNTYWKISISLWIQGVKNDITFIDSHPFGQAWPDGFLGWAFATSKIIQVLQETACACDRAWRQDCLCFYPMPRLGLGNKPFKASQKKRISILYMIAVSSWGHLGTILRPSWGHLGPVWPTLGPSWSFFGAIDSGDIRAILDHQRFILGANLTVGPVVVRFGAARRHVCLYVCMHVCIYMCI